MKIGQEYKRDVNLDIIRTVAVLGVLTLHGFILINYHNQPFSGARMMLAAPLRALSMTCVPLFLLLTGYLLCKKELSGRYYKGLIPVLFTYVLCSALVLAFRDVAQGVHMSWSSRLFSILNYTGAPYGWYINMYIGLFLLIPFLNLLWAALPSERHKQALVVMLVVLTALPSILNRFDFQTPGALFLPVKSQGAQALLPAYWEEKLWPFTYYFLGIYLREHPLPRSRKQSTINFLALAGTMLVTSLWYYYRFRQGVYAQEQDWHSILYVAESVALFVWLKGLSMRKAPRWLAWFVCITAQLSLGVYIISYIPDSLLYPWFGTLVVEVPHRLVWLPLLVVTDFLVSWLLAALVQGIYLGLYSFFAKLLPPKPGHRPQKLKTDKTSKGRGG